MPEDLVQIWDRAVQKSRDRSWIPARLGKLNSDGTYTVDVPGKDDWVHVRKGLNGKQGATIARNMGVAKRPNMPVRMRRENGELVVREINPGTAIIFTGSGSQTGNVSPHTHRRGSGYEYEIEMERLDAGRVKPWDGGMVVYITPFRYQKADGSWETWLGGTIDLTSYAPSTTGNHAWVLVGVDPSDNTAAAATETEYSYATPLTLDLIDDIDFGGKIPLGAVKVRQDDTALTDWRDYEDAHGWFNRTSGETGEIYTPSTALWPSTTNGAAEPAKTEHITNDVDLYTVDFDQTTIEYAQFNVWMPDTWDAGTLTFKAVWTAASGSGNVEFQLQGRAYANDDAIDAAWGTAQASIDTLLATGDIHYSPESSAITLAGTPAAGELVQFRVSRNTGTASNLAADAGLVGLKIYYGKS